MIPLIIIAVFLCLIGVLLFGPIVVMLEYKDGFDFKVKYLFFKVFEPEEKPDTESKEVKDDAPKPPKKENLFDTLKEKFGFTGAVQKLMELFGAVLTHIKKLLRHIKINKVVLNITAASTDAATTAVEYGAICGAAYPVLGILSGVSDIAYKAINISADFNNSKTRFDFSLNIKCNLFFLGIAAVSAFMEYKKFTERYVNNERKQH